MFAFAIFIGIAMNSLQAQVSKTGNGFQNLFQSGIDQFDTIIFDMSLATTSGSYVEFPVYIKSDDSIFSFDFAFKYDHNHLAFDTILDLTNYMQSLSYYNQFDSTVRFTSNSFQQFTIDTPLVSVRFYWITGNIQASYLYQVAGYLNGEPCSIRLFDSLTTGLTDWRIENEPDLTIYPNPAIDALYFQSSIDGKAQILDLNANLIGNEYSIRSKCRNSIVTRNMDSGHYLLRISDGSKVFYRKFLKQ